MHFSICVVWCFTMFYHHLQKVIEKPGNYIQNLPAWKRKLTCHDISARWILRENHGGCQNFRSKTSCYTNENPCMVYLSTFGWFLWWILVNIHHTWMVWDKWYHESVSKFQSLLHEAPWWSFFKGFIGKYTVNLWTFTRIDWKKWSANPNHPKSSIVSTMCFG